ncbi:MAG: hypothetical protein KI791_13430 [Cyclobacteriaceae bacterium]|nr:hypothetical protein [Cyclobacteriaceae bacterium SS2]
MESVRINIKSTEAKKYLQELEARNLIEIKSRTDFKKELSSLAKKLRAKNKGITDQDIIKEVKSFRTANN